MAFYSSIIILLKPDTVYPGHTATPSKLVDFRWYNYYRPILWPDTDIGDFDIQPFVCRLSFSEEFVAQVG